MGPRLKDVEDFDPDCQHEIRNDASMGPRLKDVEDLPPLVTSIVRRGLASMGPRLKDVEDAGDGCAGRLRQRPRFNGATSQGRGRPAPAAPLAAWLTSASMGPRLKDVEDGGPRGKPHGDRSASMGPRLKDVEDVVDRDGSIRGTAMLQWGHVSRTWKTLK